MSDRALNFLFSVFMIVVCLGTCVLLLMNGQAESVDGLFLILMGIERFLVEIVRAKDDRFLGPFTIAQLISVILVIVGTALMMRRSAVQS